MSKKNLRLLILGVIILVIVVGVVWYYKSTVSGGVVRAPGSQCIDSDGDDPYTKGEVEYMGQVFEDECSTWDTLSEKYCKQSIITKKWYPAAKDVGCVDGCEDEACVYGEKTQTGA